MTGPEHYREAERLTQQAEDVMNADYGWMASLSSEERRHRRTAFLLEAQAHATLALAAATALRPAQRSVNDPVYEAWREAAR